MRVRVRRVRRDSGSDEDRAGGRVLAVGPGYGQRILAVLLGSVDAAEVPRRGPPRGHRRPQLAHVRPLLGQLRRVRRAPLPRARPRVQDRESGGALPARSGAPLLAGGRGRPAAGAEAQDGDTGAAAAGATARI